jgi:hypothetical protein
MKSATFAQDGTNSFNSANSLILWDNTTNKSVSVTPSWSTDGTTVTLLPTGGFTENHSYTVKLAGTNSNGNMTVEDANGNKLANDFALNFATGSDDTHQQ